MRLYLRTSKPEALVVDDNNLTHWSLTIHPSKLESVEIGPDAQISADIILNRTCIVELMFNDNQFLVYPTANIAWNNSRLNKQSEIEVRNWDRLEKIGSIFVPQENIAIYSLSTSPDGHWIAIGGINKIILYDNWNQRFSHLVEWGDIIHSLLFDPTSTYLAASTSGQGGGATSVFRIENEQLDLFYNELNRYGIRWKSDDLADTSASMAFSSNSQILVIYYDAGSELDRSGEIVAYNMDNGERLWHRVFLPPDPSFHSDVVFTLSGRHLVCGSYHGQLFIFDATDGSLVQWIDSKSESPIQALARQTKSPDIWAVVDHQLQRFSISE